MTAKTPTATPLQAVKFEFNGVGRLARKHDCQHHCPADFSTPDGPETGIYLWGLNALYLSTLGKLGFAHLSLFKEFSQQLPAAIALQQLSCPKQQQPDHSLSGQQLLAASRPLPPAPALARAAECIGDAVMQPAAPVSKGQVCTSRL